MKCISEDSCCNSSSDNNSNINETQDKSQELVGDEEANEENDKNDNVDAQNEEEEELSNANKNDNAAPKKKRKYHMKELMVHSIKRKLRILKKIMKIMRQKRKN